MDWDMRDLEPKRWTDEVDLSCPYCKSEMSVDPDDSWYAVTLSCGECGFGCVATPPREISPLKGVVKEIRL